MITKGRVFACHFDGQSEDAQAAAQIQESLQLGEYGISKQGLEAGLGYAGKELAIGGYPQAGKYSLMTGDVLNASAKPLGDVGTNLGGVGARTGDILAMRAAGQGGVGQQKVLSAVDEINKLRSTLSSNGLKTTGLGAEAGSLSNQALSQEAKNPTLSTALGAASGAASIYGALSQPSAKPSPTGAQTTLQSGETGSAGGPATFSLFGPDSNAIPISRV